MSVYIQDLVTCAIFGDARLRGLGVARGRIFHFPIDLRRRPYNTLALQCECATSYQPSSFDVSSLRDACLSTVSPRARY